MSVAKYQNQSTNPSISSSDHLPTMYDLKSEDIEDPGLPDEFHIFQPQLLRDTFHPANYSPEKVFVATDLNLYYDLSQTNWYKRPDWFAVVGVDRLYEKKELRMSYVIWQEKVNPLIMIELLSPGTEKEDLGETTRESNQPPTKWQVYEQILKIPYYLVYDRYTDKLRTFKLTGNRYQEMKVNQPRIWIEEIEIGIGLWQGKYQGIERKWLRWYDKEGQWIETEVERERQEKELAQQQIRRLAERLREMGINPDEV